MRLKNEILGITNLATNPAFNAKINDFKGKIHSITNLSTTVALTTVEDKISNASDLVKKTDYNTKINEIENTLLIMIIVIIILLHKNL